MQSCKTNRLYSLVYEILFSLLYIKILLMWLLFGDKILIYSSCFCLLLRWLYVEIKNSELIYYKMGFDRKTTSLIRNDNIIFKQHRSWKTTSLHENNIISCKLDILIKWHLNINYVYLKIRKCFQQKKNVNLCFLFLFVWEDCKLKSSSFFYFVCSKEDFK